MKLILHHLTSEYKIHAKVMWFTLVILLAICYALSIDASKVDSVQIIWYSLVAGMVTSSAYKKDFSLKYYTAMPIPRDQLILIIVLGRVLYFIPGAVTLTVYYSALPRDPLFNHSWPLLMITYFIGISIFNAIQVLGDIENPRIESVPGRFESFLMFFKKIGINYILGSSLLVGGFILIKSSVEVLGLHFINNQFLIILYGGAVLTFLMYRCHHIFLNEHLSYWSWKKDGALATLLIAASIFPAIAFKQKAANFAYNHGPTPYFQAVDEIDQLKLRRIDTKIHDINAKNELGYTPILVAVRNGDLDSFITLKSMGASLTGDEIASASPLDPKKFKEKYNSLKLAILSNNPKMLETILQQELYGQGHNLDALHFAAHNCKAAVIPTLIEFGFNPNQALENGQSSLFYATQTNCYSAVLELALHGADVKLKDKSGKEPKDYTKSFQMHHVLKRFESKKMQQNRLPASTNLANPHLKR
ncbi:MAG: hypothetical protein CME71_04760 [Halobacteriovorax sp.]|nr:hypothetical protein [Halobacteriovorax sp.]